MHEAVQLVILAREWVCQMYLIMGTEQVCLTHVLCKPTQSGAVSLFGMPSLARCFVMQAKTTIPT